MQEGVVNKVGKIKPPEGTAPRFRGSLARRSWHLSTAPAGGSALKGSMFGGCVR
jgi:hypothetical protein